MVTTKDGHFRSELARCRSAWTSCRSRPILIGRREDDLLSGGFRRRGARCCVVVSREEEEPECSQVPEHDVTPCPEAVVAFGRRCSTRTQYGHFAGTHFGAVVPPLTGYARDSRRSREPKKTPPIKPQAGVAFTIERSRRAAQSARWECLTSDPKREIIVLSGGSQFCSPTRCCPRLLAHSFFFIRQLRFLRIRNPREEADHDTHGGSSRET
jgi:hypothetical protein